MKKKISIIEVGPRDGFQNIAEYIPVEEKLKIIGAMVRAGVRHIEHTSFVSPRAIPQLRDAEQVTKALLEQYPDVEFFPLVPNLRGAQNAAALGLKKVAYVVSLSVSHNKANINRTHAESLAELLAIREAYPGLEICVDIATAFGCPFEGKLTDPEILADFLADYVAAGVQNFCLCDTIGIADPAQLRRILKTVTARYPQVVFEVHIHDTRNMGIANTLAAIECGITRVQSTLGGLGGCPFAPGASGNTATEDLVFMLNEMGYDTGIDFERILAAAKYERTVVEGTYSGHHINIEKTTPCTGC